MNSPIDSENIEDESIPDFGLVLAASNVFYFSLTKSMEHFTMPEYIRNRPSPSLFHFRSRSKRSDEKHLCAMRASIGSVIL